MTDAPDDLILRLLREIRADMQEIRVRVVEIASTQSAMLQILGNLSTRIDRIDDRLLRVERRLDLVEV